MTEIRFKLIDWSQNKKFIEDSKGELPTLEFDNMKDAQKWYDSLTQLQISNGAYAKQNHILISLLIDCINGDTEKAEQMIEKQGENKYYIDFKKHYPKSF